MSISRTSPAVPRTIWAGLVAAAFYVLIAGVVGNLLDPLAGGDEVLGFVISTWVPVAVLIVIGVLFARRAGWLAEAWTAPSPFTERRRWWLLAIPVALVVQISFILGDVPWSQREVPAVLIYLVGSLLIGLGEELYFRGILRVAVRGQHRELTALLVTSIAFGVAHTAGYMIHGVPIGTTALSVAFLAMNGALFYGALRATGTLWVPIVLHGLGDFARFLQVGSGAHEEAQSFGGDAGMAGIEYVLVGLSIALVVSIARSDRHDRRDRRAQEGLTSEG